MLMKRTLKFYTALMLIFSALLLRIFQVMHNDSKLSVLSDGRKYSVTLTTQRGDILDRNGHSLLSGEKDIYAVCVPPLRGGTYAAERLAEASGLSESRINKLIAESFPFALRVNDESIRLENVNLLEIPRRFPSDGVAAHIIGYTAEGGANGVCGLEAAFNDVLKTESAVTASVSVAARRGTLTDVFLTHTGNGGVGGIKITIDKYLSQISRIAFQAVEGNECGSVVIMNVKNGDILTCESFPDYDPNNVAFSLNGENAPLMNRAFSAFNLGSAFKIVTATALIEEQKTDIAYTCNGYIHVGNKDVSCHNESGHGKETLSDAFANSCNPYFIKSALTIGKDSVYDAAERFGFGIATRLAEGMVSSAGNMPQKRSLASSAALANFSIGQGELMATPLQVAIMVSSVANGGLKPKARLVESIYDEFGDTVKIFDTETPERIISEETAAELRNLMINAVENGTGKKAKPKSGNAGGKTATAQTGSFSEGKRKNNAWFAGFFPAENPEYAIVVLVENGSSGSVNAAPVFKSICDYLSESAHLAQTP